MSQYTPIRNLFRPLRSNRIKDTIDGLAANMDILDIDAGASTTLRETLSGVINGINTTFTTSVPYVSGTTFFWLNGLAQSDPEDYSEDTNTTIIMVDPPLSGDRLIIQFVEA